MRCNLIQTDQELPILLYYCDISETSVGKWLVRCVQKRALENELENEEDLLNEVRRRFDPFFIDGTTIFSRNVRTNWDCLRLIKRAGKLSSFSLSQLEHLVITKKLQPNAEIRLPDYFADILEERSTKKARLNTIAGSIKYHLALAYLVGDKFPANGQFIFSNSICDQRALDQLFRTFINSREYYMAVPQPAGYGGTTKLHQFPLAYGMSTWPDETIPSFDDIRQWNWREISLIDQKVQFPNQELVNTWNIDYKSYGDICVFRLLDFCFGAAPEFVACVLPTSENLIPADRQSFGKILASTAQVNFRNKVTAALALFTTRSFLITPDEIRDLTYEKLLDPLLAVELPGNTYLKLEDYLATLTEDELRRTLPSSWGLLPLEENFTPENGDDTFLYEMLSRRIIRLGRLLERRINDTDYVVSQFCRNGNPKDLLLDFSSLSTPTGIAKLRNLNNYTMTSKEFLAGGKLPSTNYGEILIDGVPLPNFLSNLEWNTQEVKDIAYQVLSGVRPSSLLEFTIIESEQLSQLSDQEIQKPKLLIRENDQLFFEEEYTALLLRENRVQTTLLKRRQRIIGF
jgi:hypothetical protein